MRPLLALLLAALPFFSAGCSEAEPEYRLIYPIQASKQQLHRLDGVRFLSTTDAPELSLIVLSNPVEDAAFVDIAFAVTNTTPELLTVTPKMLNCRTKSGSMTIADRSGYEQRIANGEHYRRPEGFDKLMPKMQAFGCAAPNTRDTADKASLKPSQKQAWKHYRNYLATGAPDAGDYFTGFELNPGETRSAFVRIDLPRVDAEAERETMLFSLCPADLPCRKVRLVIQPL
jgi:hypothetical protein